MADNSRPTILLPPFEQQASASPNPARATPNSLSSSERNIAPTMEHPDQEGNRGSTEELDQEISRWKAALVADAPPDSDPSNQSDSLESRLKLMDSLYARYRQTGRLEDRKALAHFVRDVRGDSKQPSQVWNEMNHAGRQLGAEEALLGSLPSDVAEMHNLDGEVNLSVLSSEESMVKQLPRDSGYGSSAGMASKDDRSIHPILTNAPKIQLGSEKEENLVSAFAVDLCQDLQIDGRLKGERQRMLPRLHSLLEGFSMRLQENKLSANERNAAEFVRQQRENIASQVRKAYGKSNTPEDDGPSGPSNDGLKIEQKMALWPTGEVSEPPPPEAPPVEDKQDPVLGSPRYQQVRAFLREGPAYSWLLEKARISASLTDTTGTSLQKITSTLDDLFELMRERSMTGPVFNARFEIDWDLLGFLRRQKYDTTLEIAVEQAITLTGTARDAQAMTCVDYMSQIWPSSGPEILRALQKALRSPSLSCQTRLSDGTDLQISLQSPKATVYARGGRAALTELCEQLAWLGSALGAGPEDTSPPSRLWLATPTIVAFNSGQLYAKWPSITVRIRFPIRSIPDSSSAEGTCWHAMFHHPVVVDGFPIVARRDRQKGLEVPTRMMLALAESDYATHYAETVVLKGFCSMLVPTARADGSIVWHYLHNPDGSWLPYNGFREKCPGVVSNEVPDADVLTAGNTRNFVGWASAISRNLGTNEVNYEAIQPADAPECSTEITIEKKPNTPVSKLFETSAPFVRGDRDRSLIGRKDAYAGKVDAARGLPVLLYDAATRRGWLVDGASALLHIARSRVAHPPHRSTSHFDDTAVNGAPFKHPSADGGPDAAAAALKDLENREHIVNSAFGGDDEQAQADPSGRPEEQRRRRRYTPFKQLVSDTWDAFDQIHSRQLDDDARKTSPNQQPRSPTPAIEGYEYMDLVAPRGPLARRRVVLDGGNGVEWSGFVARINAIALFGRHFGDVYSPKCDDEGSRELRAPWRNVPAGRDFLAVPVSLLRELDARAWEDGESDRESPEVARRVLWTPEEGAFGPCTTTTTTATGERESCAHEFADRVQRLAAARNVAHKDDAFAVRDGAVVFGGGGGSGQLRDANASYSDSGYNSSHEASPAAARAAGGGGGSDAGEGSASIVVQSSTPGVASAESGRADGMSSIATSPPFGSEGRPATAPGQSGGATSTASRTGRPPEPAASKTAKQGVTAAAAAAGTGKPSRRRPFRLREALLVRKFREWRRKIRSGTTLE